MQLIPANESFECVLGIDTALRVSYATDSRTVEEPARSFAEPFKTTTRSATTGVTNGHAFDIANLVVRDALPLGDSDANIKVVLRAPGGLAHAQADDAVPVDVEEGDVQDVKVRWTKVVDGRGGEKDGMYEWLCGIPAGKKVVLKAEWDIRVPGSLPWEEKETA